MATIKDKLSGYCPEQPYLIRKSLSVKEKGKKYSLSFSPERLCASFQVDGYIIASGQKCDKLIVVEIDSNDWAEIFIELKGQDISHAIEQLEASLKNTIFNHNSVKAKRARIVGKSIPRSNGNSIVERAKIRFKRDYNCDLRVFGSAPNEKF